MSPSTDFHSVIDAWHGSDPDDKRIAGLAAALDRYDTLGPAYRAVRDDATNALDDIATKVAAGTVTFADGIAEWTHRSSPLRPNKATGAHAVEVFYDQCRRHARKAVEAAAARIDWQDVFDGPDATDELRLAIRCAGLA